MNFTAELKTNIKLNQTRSIGASVVSAMASKDNAGIEAMHEILEELVKNYVPQNTEIKTVLKIQEGPKMASSKQIGLIKFMLKRAECSEHDLCRQYSVRQLNDLSMEEAGRVIQDLKTSHLFKER